MITVFRDIFRTIIHNIFAAPDNFNTGTSEFPKKQGPDTFRFTFDIRILPHQGVDMQGTRSVRLYGAKRTGFPPGSGLPEVPDCCNRVTAIMAKCHGGKVIPVKRIQKFGVGVAN